VGTASSIAITVTAVTDTSVNATFAIAPNASIGTVPVQVSVKDPEGSDYLPSNIVNFTIDPPIPTSVSGPTLDGGTTYTGQPLLDCAGNQKVSAFWGYRYCGTYTVLDQNGAAMKQSGISLAEAIVVVKSNPANPKSGTGSATTNSSGQFRDTLAYGFTSAPTPQPGEYIIDNQTITTTINGQQTTLRINCINFQSNGVTVKNITSGGSCP
jgi:hypothetical protein